MCGDLAGVQSPASSRSQREEPPFGIER
jgi:hypothetical protein